MQHALRVVDILNRIVQLFFCRVLKRVVLYLLGERGYVRRRCRAQLLYRIYPLAQFFLLGLAQVVPSKHGNVVFLRSRTLLRLWFLLIVAF